MEPNQIDLDPNVLVGTYAQRVAELEQELMLMRAYVAQLQNRKGDSED